MGISAASPNANAHDCFIPESETLLHPSRSSRVIIGRLAPDRPSLSKVTALLDNLKTFSLVPANCSRSVTPRQGRISKWCLNGILRIFQFFFRGFSFTNIHQCYAKLIQNLHSMYFLLSEDNFFKSLFLNTLY